MGTTSEAETVVLQNGLLEGCRGSKRNSSSQVGCSSPRLFKWCCADVVGFGVVT